MIFGTLFGDSGEAFGDQGGTKNPQDGLQMPPQRFIEAPWWPKDGHGNEGRIFEEKRHLFEALGKSKIWLKHSK